MTFDELEKEYFKNLYSRNKGNITDMQKESGLSRATIYRKMQKYFDDFRYNLKETK